MGRLGILRRVASVSLVSLALGSCSTRRPAPAPVPGPTPVVVAPTPRAPSPAAYVASAASIDLFVVRASEMELARNLDPRVAEIATRLRDDHRGLAAQLSLAGRRLDVLPAATLAPREERRLARLAARTSTDIDYLVEMHAVHDQSIALHRAFAARGASPTLRPVAANAARTERAHLTLLGRGRSN